MEVEDWIDGINQPAWKRTDKQIIGPDSDPYVLQASHVFTSVKDGQRRRNRPKDLREEKIEEIEFL
jgi:hypothetical protein